MKYILPTVSVTLLIVLFIIIVGILIFISIKLDNKEPSKEVVKVVQKPQVVPLMWPRWFRRRRPYVRQVIKKARVIPVVNPLIGGCAGTRYGCCPDGVTSKNSDASNCKRRY